MEYAFKAYAYFLTNLRGGYFLQKFRAGSSKLAINQEEFKTLPKIVDITSSQFVNGGSMPVGTTQFGGNNSPDLDIKVDRSAKEVESLMLFIQDADIPFFTPAAHMLVYNIEPSNASFKYNEFLNSPNPKRFKFGVGSRGRQGYIGPRPPPSHGPHCYHFQVFALNKVATDKMNSFKTTVAWEDALQAIKGNVVGLGDLVGVYENKA